MCDALDDLDTDGGLDALMALFAPDVVVSDAMTGESYSGFADVADYSATRNWLRDRSIELRGGQQRQLGRRKLRAPQR